MRRGYTIRGGFDLPDLDDFRGQSRPVALWTVRWKRDGWTASNSRGFQHRRFAERFIDKLMAGDRDDLAHIEFIRVERRELGPVQFIAEWSGGWVEWADGL